MAEWSKRSFDNRPTRNRVSHGYPGLTPFAIERRQPGVRVLGSQFEKDTGPSTHFWLASTHAHISPERIVPCVGFFSVRNARRPCGCERSRKACPFAAPVAAPPSSWSNRPNPFDQPGKRKSKQLLPTCPRSASRSGGAVG